MLHSDGRLGSTVFVFYDPCSSRFVLLLCNLGERWDLGCFVQENPGLLVGIPKAIDVRGLGLEFGRRSSLAWPFCEGILVKIRPCGVCSTKVEIFLADHFPLEFLIWISWL